MFVAQSIASFLKWSFITESPLGLGFGQDCLDFPNRTLCFLNELPAQLPQSITVYPNQEVSHASIDCQRNAQWHLPRITQSRLERLEFPHDPQADGAGVDVYVLDTWVDTSHSKLRGSQRLRSFESHDPQKYPAHGTHCAGLVGGDQYGVARAAQIFSVQVLDDEGTGTWDVLLRGVHYAWQNSKQRRRPTILSISITGARSDAVNHALEDLMQDGVLVVVAAGNSNDDAVQYSPASADVLVAAASTVQDVRSPFSNWGRPVRLFAPGSNIVSLCPREQLCAMSGTSMSTPIIAGIAAVEWSRDLKMSARDLMRKLDRQAVRNVLRGVPHGTQNKLAQLSDRARCAKQNLFFQPQVNPPPGSFLAGP